MLKNRRLLINRRAGELDLRPVVSFGVERWIDVDQINLASQAGSILVPRQERSHCQQVVTVDEAVGLPNAVAAIITP